jgi:hypothetical protein
MLANRLVCCAGHGTIPESWAEHFPRWLMGRAECAHTLCLHTKAKGECAQVGDGILKKVDHQVDDVKAQFQNLNLGRAQIQRQQQQHDGP